MVPIESPGRHPRGPRNRFFNYLAATGTPLEHLEVPRSHTLKTLGVRLSGLTLTRALPSFTGRHVFKMPSR